MMEALRTRWVVLAQRERRMVVAATVIAAAALVFLAGIEPAWKARARAAAELPRLHEQVAEMQAVAQEAKQLRSRGAAPSTPDAAKEALAQSLAQTALGSARVTVVDERRIAVEAKGVPIVQWLAWSEEAARESRLRIAEVKIAATAARGTVDAGVTFEVAKRP